jgi:hypothetical protein
MNRLRCHTCDHEGARYLLIEDLLSPPDPSRCRTSFAPDKLPTPE